IALTLSDQAHLLAAVTGPQVEGRYEVSVYDTRSLNRLGSWVVPAEDLDDIHFSRAGKLLAASLLTDGAHVVQLWSVPDGKPLATLTVESRYTHWLYVQKPQRLDFSLDGRSLVAASSTGNIKAWDLDALSQSGTNRPRGNKSSPTEVFAFSAHLGEAWSAQ